MPAVSRPTCPTERISAAMSAKLPCPGWPTSASDRAASIAKDAEHSRQAGQVDRKSVVEGKRVAVRVDLHGRRTIKQHSKTRHKQKPTDTKRQINKQIEE